MSNRSSPWDRKGHDMNNGTGRGETWVQLVRDVLGSWRLLVGAVVLMLAGTPAAVVVILLLLG